ncbi:Spy/CpxP family protein refolding chaperone [Phenylobacterium deserti]|uniref:LTXXQ motif family protein n=1 Tax=Phenylobacterium deserti TaxID=1914756 RepID=A0A328AQY0_9CAUL|nr:Spy/CpxP family protein refolding chaperone [Phenylobacterium deserti]RAK57433.1 hypothetical protein DJ018_05700 [Phenylobacterium deserti]
MKTTSMALAAALTVSLGGTAMAQAPQPGPAPRGEAGDWRRPDPAQMAERRAQRLRDTLQLRADQEPALRAFVADSTPQRQRGRMRQDRGEMRNLTTPQRLDRMQARMVERQQRFAQHAAAVKRFYAQLSPAQQKAFDAQHQSRGKQHRGPGLRGGGPRGGHMG